MVPGHKFCPFHLFNIQATPRSSGGNGSGGGGCGGGGGGGGCGDGGGRILVVV